MRHQLLCLLALFVVSVSACKGSPAEELVLVSNNTSAYSIVVPAKATAREQHAATVLQSNIQLVSGKLLPVVNEGTGSISAGIYIGDTRRSAGIIAGKAAPESYRLQAMGKDLVITGGSGKGLVYGVYYLLEQYLHCRKIADDEVIITRAGTIKIPGDIHEEHKPQFLYREAYYPASHDAAYLEWNQLHRLEDLWGLWGHSYNKLVPASTYFKAHPEYYALVKGVRQPTQLCLGSDAVYNIVLAELKRRIAANPDALYWSVSPNDDNGYCECDKCRPVDAAEGTPAGSLIRFVNRIAAALPDNNITTLAYGYTHRAPRTLKPAKNVFVFLSDIDAYRDKPLAEEGSAGTFRNDLRDWGAITPNLFIWDYVTQFTAYLAPFPNFHTLQPNMQYLQEHGVKGIFVQGPGDTYGEWAELRGYLVAKLLQNDKADVKQLTTQFLSDYYGPAAPHLQQYIDVLQQKMLVSKRKLDIYGNPINQWDTYLSPEALDAYSAIFDKAEAAVETNPKLAERVMRARLPLEYTVLQQARFYGIEKFGIFIENSAGGWDVKPKFKEKVSRFVANCKKAKVTELSEGGLNPDAYQAEWNAIYAAGVAPTNAIGAAVAFKYPYAEDFPAKGDKTLVDGNPGYSDFSYNWLCFYGVPMEATIDLGRLQSISTLKMHFLDDPRHWIFLPEQITVEVSADGVQYTRAASLSPQEGEEHYDVAVKEFAAQSKGQARYIKVTAANRATLPAWRTKDNKKPMIACDEVWVQ